MRAGRFYNAQLFFHRGFTLGKRKSMKTLKNADGKKGQNGIDRQLFGNGIVLPAQQAYETRNAGEKDSEKTIDQFDQAFHRSHSASSQLCQTFWTSSLSSNMSSIFCMFFASSSFVSLI